MANQQISKKDAEAFLDRFSKDHEGCLMRVEISAGGGQNTNIAAAGLPLIGVSVSGDAGGLNVMLGDKADNNYERNVSAWSNLSLEGDSTLVIQGDDGSVTRLHCTDHGTGASRQRGRQRTGEDSGLPGGGAGRRDEVGHSGVYPMSRPEGASGEAALQGEKSWGQGRRGGAGYDDSGSSEIHPPGSADND